jgi:hypothetical protein
MPENAHKAKEFSNECAWIADAYAGALVYLWWFIWRYNHRVFPIRLRRWDRYQTGNERWRATKGGLSANSSSERVHLSEEKPMVRSLLRTRHAKGRFDHA